MVEHVILGGKPHFEGQDLNEVTINERLNRMAHRELVRVIDRDLTTPPGSPGEGDIYIVATSATGEWLEHDEQLAAYFGRWQYRDLQDGEVFVLLDEGSGSTGMSWCYHVYGTIYVMQEP